MPGRSPARPIARLAGLLVALLPVLAGWLGGPETALGSCGRLATPEEALRTSSIVFVGTVVQGRNDGRWVLVRVEERWRGARDLPELVEVRGGPDPGLATSVDRSYVPGRYLFAVEPGPGHLLDNACSATSRWKEDLAPLRPSGVEPWSLSEEEAGAEPVDLRPVLALAAALVIAVTAYGFILRGRNRPPDWVR